MKEFFIEIFFRPLLNIAIGIYNNFSGQDLGIAIIILTLIMKLVLFPLSRKAIRSQIEMAAVTPKLNALKEKYKDDKKAQSEAVMRLYKEHGINPLSGCLPLIIQIPLLIALYQVFLAISAGKDMELLYGFIQNPGTVQATFLGLVDLAHPSRIMAVIAGVAQFFQAKLSLVKSSQSTSQANVLNTQMLYFFPVMIIIISWSLPAGLSLYWITTTVFSLAEQVVIRRTMPVHSHNS